MKRILSFILFCFVCSFSYADITSQAILNQMNQTLSSNQSITNQGATTTNAQSSAAPTASSTQQVQPQQAKLPQNAPQNYWYVVLVFKSTCPYCQQFDPTLMDFIQKTGFSLISFTTDGGVLPGMHYALPFTPEVLKKFHPDKIPAVYLANKYSNQDPILISEGVISEQDLANRIYTVLSQVGDGQQ